VIAAARFGGGHFDLESLVCLAFSLRASLRGVAFSLAPGSCRGFVGGGIPIGSSVRRNIASHILYRVGDVVAKPVGQRLEGSLKRVVKRHTVRHGAAARG
jgi:hypothetical protein